MKMPSTQSSENGLYDYDDSAFITEGVENNSVEEFNPSPEDDFSEYLWMENEEEFDKEVMQRLEEEALMEDAIQAMLADEVNEVSGNHDIVFDSGSNDITTMISNLKIESPNLTESKLNPLAAEFVPGGSSPASLSTTLPARADSS